MTDRPNVLLVILDTARAREMALGSRGPSVTPSLREMAHGGRVWRRAIAPGIWTAPSHASLFSGLYPSEHRVIGRRYPTEGGWRPEIERLGDRWLPTLMARAGYDTFSISANAMISPMMGWGRGFRRWLHVRPGAGGRRSERSRQLLPPSSASRRARRIVRAAGFALNISSPGDRGAQRALTALGRYLGERRRSPFFGFLNLMEAHAPYWTPGASSLPLGVRFRGLSLVAPGAQQRRMQYNAGRRRASPSELAAIRRFYAAALTYLDGALARAFELLASRRLIDDTLLVVASDHGEHLGERGVIGHVLSLHDELVHVPAFAVGAVDGGVVDEPTSTIALRSMILERAGVATEERAADPAAEYESMRAVSPSFRASRPLVDTQGIALYEDGWKLWAESDGTERFFRLLDDGDEEEANDQPPAVIAERLRKRRDAWLARLDGAVPARRGSETAISRQEMREIEEHLVDLGYLG